MGETTRKWDREQESEEVTRELGVDPQADFFRIYGWLIKIYGCFSAMPQNCGEGNLWLKIRNLWLLFG